MKESRPLAEQMAQLNTDVDNSNNAVSDTSYMDASSLRNETCPAALLRSNDESAVERKFAPVKRMMNPSRSMKQEPTNNQESPTPISTGSDVSSLRKDVSGSFKISLCDAFSRTGQCSYGTSCRFAHGKNELRIPRTAKLVRFQEELANEFGTPSKRQKAEKKICRNFRLGNCRFGAKCHFSHQPMNNERLPKLMNTTIQPYVDQSFVDMSRPMTCETPAPPQIPPQQMFNPQQVHQPQQQHAPMFNNYAYPEWYCPNPFAPPQPPPQYQPMQEWFNAPYAHPAPHPMQYINGGPPPMYGYYNVIPQNGLVNQYQPVFNPNIAPMHSPYYPQPPPPPGQVIRTTPPPPPPPPANPLH